jgi:hypothetical protein
MQPVADGKASTDSGRADQKNAPRGCHCDLLAARKMLQAFFTAARMRT